jgi:acyl-CoA thioester hydrolase
VTNGADLPAHGGKSAPFRVRIGVRTYELDTLGHLNQAVYHSYAEHARTELMRSMGLPVDRMLASGTAPVLLTGEMRYLRELRADDEVDVSAELRFGTGKTFHVDSVLTKADGTVSAEFSGTFGLLDLAERRLLADPRARLAAASSDPAAFEAAAN